MRITESQLRQIIREELEQDDIEMIDIMAEICSSVASRAFDGFKLLDYRIMSMTKSIPEDKLPAVEIMQAILTRTMDLPDREAFSPGAYFRFLDRALKKVDRVDVQSKFPSHYPIEMPNEIRDIDIMMAYLINYYASNNRRRISNIDSVDEFMTRYNNVKNNPDALITWMSLRDSIPKLAKFFGDRQNPEYEDHIIRLLRERELGSIMQAAELADMMS